MFPVIVADSEHFSGELIREIHQNTAFDLLVPIPSRPVHRKQFQAIEEKMFKRRWAGYATAKVPMALIAQAAIHGLRHRLGDPYCNWDANHLAKYLFFRLEGDVRVTKDSIIVTYYNAPNAKLLVCEILFWRDVTTCNIMTYRSDSFDAFVDFIER